LLFLSFNCSPTPADSTLSLHDALPIYRQWRADRPADRASWSALPHLALRPAGRADGDDGARCPSAVADAGEAAARPVQVPALARSEEHTSELQSRENLVCRLLLEKKTK